MLDFMVSIVPPFMQHYQFVVAGMDKMPEELYGIIKNNDSIKIVYGQTYDLLNNAHAAVVTSGTATLETALFRVPEVVCYKSTFITYKIAKAVIKVKFISLVNLIAGKEVVKELIQDQFTPSILSSELRKIVNEGADRNRVLKDYDELKAQMGDTETSARTADLMLAYLRDAS
jgi:lipid-A-disaccharide synthase